MHSIQIIFILIQILCVLSLPYDEGWTTTIEPGQIEETTILTPLQLQLNSTTTTAKTVEKIQVSTNSPVVKPVEIVEELDTNGESENSTIHVSKRQNLDGRQNSVGAEGAPEQGVGLDDLTEDLGTWKAPYNIERNFPYYLAGYDEESRPIWVFEYGKMDLRSIVSKGEKHQAALIKYFKQHAYILHKNLREISTPERNITEVMYLMDFDELQLRQVAYVPNLNFLLKLALDHRDLFIKHIGSAIVINTNYLAEQVVNLIKPVFGPVAEKIEVYGTNKQKWIPVVRRIFGPQNLPDWYGGTKDFKPVAVYG